MKRINCLITIYIVYVNDIILTDDDLVSIIHLEQYLDSTFSIKDLVQLHYFLGIEINRLAEEVVLTQHKFAKDLLVASSIT